MAKKSSCFSGLPTKEKLRMISLSKLDARLPREEWDPVALEALGRYISQEGLLHPLVVEPGRRGRFVVVEGQAWFLIAKKFSNLKKLLCTVRTPR